VVVHFVAKDQQTTCQQLLETETGVIGADGDS